MKERKALYIEQYGIADHVSLLKFGEDEMLLFYE